MLVILRTLAFLNVTFAANRVTSIKCARPSVIYSEGFFRCVEQMNGSLPRDGTASQEERPWTRE